MAKITLYTGGARSGKSSCAQKAAEAYGDVAYIATAINTDKEMGERIKKHIASRPKRWHTYECPYDIAPTIAGTGHEAYIIDCVAVHITNLILEIKRDWEEPVISRGEQTNIEEQVEGRITELLCELKKSNARFIIVTNEVGMGLVPDNALGRIFRDIAGRVNQRLAQAADEVFLVVSGLPVKIKG